MAMQIARSNVWSGMPYAKPTVRTAWCSTRHSQPYIAIRAQESPQRTLAILEPFTKEYLAIAVRKGDTELRDWLNLTIFELRASGTWDSLYQTWFVKMPWRGRVKQPSS